MTLIQIQQLYNKLNNDEIKWMRSKLYNWAIIISELEFLLKLKW